MKIRELIKKLEQYNGSREVLISSDEEGNNFKEIDTVEDYEDVEVYPSGKTKKNAVIIFPIG